MCVCCLSSPINTEPNPTQPIEEVGSLGLSSWFMTLLTTSGWVDLQCTYIVIWSGPKTLNPICMFVYRYPQVSWGGYWGDVYGPHFQLQQDWKAGSKGLWVREQGVKYLCPWVKHENPSPPRRPGYSFRSGMCTSSLHWQFATATQERENKKAVTWKR